MRYLSLASRSSSLFASKLKALGRFLYRICGPDENLTLLLTQGFMLYRQDTDNSEDAGDSEDTGNSEDASDSVLERAMQILDPKCV